MMRSRPPRPILLAVLIVTTVALAGSAAPGEGAHDHGTGVATPATAAARTAAPAGPDTGTGAVYLTIRNDGNADDALVAARTDRAERVDVHDSVVTGGIARMVPLGGELTIPAGGEVVFEPGGAHLMLVNLTEDIRPGDTFAVALTFAAAGDVTIPVTAVWDEDAAEVEPVTVGDLTIAGVWSRPAPRIEADLGTPVATPAGIPAGTPTEHHDGH